MAKEKSELQLDSVPATESIATLRAETTELQGLVKKFLGEKNKGEAYKKYKQLIVLYREVSQVQRGVVVAKQQCRDMMKEIKQTA